MSEEFIEESYVFSNNDLILNIDKWSKDKSNILYITGLSGSGKTTLAEKYEKEYKAELFGIDGLEHDYDSSNSNLLEKVKSKYPDYKVQVENKFKGLSGNEMVNILRKALLYVISEMGKTKDKLYILEGLQIFSLLDPNTLKSKPMIIKGTSMLKSMEGRFKRNGDGKIEWIDELKDGFPQLFKWYIETEKDLKKFKKEIRKESGVIMEASNKKVRKYKCPYCDYRGTKEELVHHVEEEHEELIPSEYTAARVVFNYIYKKSNGSCTICKKETEWDEVKWRYNRLCKNPKCKEEYVRQFRSRMVDVHGKETLLNDMEHQTKMLSNRSISGKYKFSDGGTRTYTGSYEKKLLEFMDKVMEIRSDDIITPGPIFEYEYEGEIHKFITDLYYIPYNLVFDVKDGGTNVNTHPGKETNRQKQIAKEDAITKAGTHNYIRLTDNNFAQLLHVFAELKLNMNEGNDMKVIHINETFLEASGIRSKDSDKKYIAFLSENGITWDDPMYIKELSLIDKKPHQKIIIFEMTTEVANVERLSIQNMIIDPRFKLIKQDVF